MTYVDLQALRHYVYQVQKIIYETHSCIIIECDKCECAYICELTNCLLKFIQHEINRYDAKGELKDDNN
jgi:hypothetical protein